MNFLTQFLNQRPDFYFNVGASLLNLVITLFNVFVNPHPLSLIILLTASCCVFSAWVASTIWKNVEGKAK